MDRAEAYMYRIFHIVRSFNYFMNVVIFKNDLLVFDENIFYKNYPVNFTLLRA